jgi:ubiquinol-cytochrome c reductase core subunit 2
MISRSTVTRGCKLALRGQSCAQTAQRRSFAAAASIGTPGSFEPTEIAGLKVASKDAGGATTRLAIVAKAGTRYQPLPGLTVGLEEFAFKVGAQCPIWGALVKTDYELICLATTEHDKTHCSSNRP